MKALNITDVARKTKFMWCAVSLFLLLCISCGGGGGGGGGSPVAAPDSSKTQAAQTASLPTDDAILPDAPILPMAPMPSVVSAPDGFCMITPVTTDVQVGNSRIFINDRFISIGKLLICTHEVTQDEFVSVMGYNPSVFQDNPDEGEVQGLRPVEGVCWNEAIVYCNKRSIREGFEPCYSLDGETNPDLWGEVPIEGTPGMTNNERWRNIACNFDANGYRLPKEVEWEYAARGGDLQQEQTMYAGCNEDELLDYAWIYDNSNNKTHQVMLKKPNALGLYDMSGNVFEWVWDNYSYDNVGITVNTPEEGPPSGMDYDYHRRMTRGGAWSNGFNGETYHGAVPPLSLGYCNLGASHCTSPWMDNASAHIALGLRVVRTVE